MKVALFINGLARGGAEGQFVSVAIELKRAGWEIFVLALREQEGYGPTLLAADIDVVIVGRGVTGLRRVIEILRRRRPNVLVSFLLQSNLLGRIAGRLVGVPVISSIRNQRFGGASWLGRTVADGLERLTNPLAKRVVVNSTVAATDLLSRKVIQPRSTVVIPNVLVAPVLDRDMRLQARIELRREFDLEDRDIAWLVVGRLVAQKNHHALLEAFTSLPVRTYKRKLLIVGDGPLRESLENSFAISRLATGSVEFLGFRTDVPRIMAAADRLVLPSLWEGLPNVIIEAMANRLLVTTTRAGGATELIQDGVTGFLAGGSLASDIATAMERAENVTTAELETITESAATKVSRYLDVESVVQRWRLLIEEVADVEDGPLESRLRIH